LQNKQKQKQATSCHNTNSAETKHTFYITCYKISRSPNRVYNSPPSATGGTDLGAERYSSHFLFCFQTTVEASE